MPKLPDPLSIQADNMYVRVPTPSAGQANASAVSHANENLAGALGQAGQAMTRFGDEQQKQTDALELVRADAAHKEAVNSLARSFDSDTDYTTQQQRFREHADASAQQAAANISNPRTREQWQLRANLHNQDHSFQIGRGADTMVKQGKIVDLGNSLDKVRDRFLDPSATDAQRADALQDMDHYIGVNQHSGLLDPKTADALRTKYLYGSVKDAAHNLAGADAQEFLSRYHRPAPPQDGQPAGGAAIEQAVPGTEAKPIGGRLLPPGQPSPQAQQPSGPVPVSDGTLQFIKDREGFAPVAKWDYRQYSGGYGTKAAPGQTFTPETAEVALKTEAAKVNDWLNNNVTAPLTENQRTALTSFGFNLGMGALEKILPDINGGNWDRVAARMPSFNKAGGEVNSNLVERRGLETTLLKTGDSGQSPSQAETLNLPSWASSLSPLDRQQLLDTAKANVAKRNSEAAVAMNNQIDSDIKRLGDTGQVLRDADGKTSIDRAREMGLPVEKYQRLWNAAALDHSITSDLPNLTEEEANSRIDHLSQIAQDPSADYAAIRSIAAKATKQLEGEIALRQSDPMAAVNKTNFVQERLDAFKSPPPVRNFDGSMGPPPMPTHLQVTQEHIKAGLDAQERLGIPSYSQRIISQKDAASLLGFGAEDPRRMTETEFRGKMNDAAQRARQAYGSEYAQRAFTEAAKFMLKTKDERSTAMGIAAKLMFGGDLTHDDVMTMRDARTLDPMAKLVQSITPRMDASLGIPAAAVTMPEMKPTPQAVELLKSRPDSWASFDKVYGAGASARTLGFAPGAKTPAPPPPSTFWQRNNPLAAPNPMTEEANAKFATAKTANVRDAGLPGSMSQE